MMINAGVNVKNLIDKGVWDKGSIWNPSNCECECNKSCDVGEYLDYENFKCMKKLVETRTGNIEEMKLARIISVEEGQNKHKYSSCALYIMLCSILFTINVGIGSYFLYLHWYLKKDVTCVTFGTLTQTTIWLLIL